MAEQKNNELLVARLKSEISLLFVKEANLESYYDKIDEIILGKITTNVEQNQTVDKNGTNNK